MAKNSQSLAARVTALEKAVAKDISERKVKTMGEKTSMRNSTKASKPQAVGRTERKTAKSRKAARAGAGSGNGPAHGIFPKNPLMFVTDEADAEAALGIRR